MRIFSRRHQGAAIAADDSVRWRSSFSLVTALVAFASMATAPVHAFNFTTVPSTNIDLNNLGSVGIAGNFTGVSLVQFAEQGQNARATNGSEGLLARLPNSAFATVLSTDASIMSMCSFLLKDGTDAGVVLGGNFTSLSRQPATAIALFNPNTSQVTPMPGLLGQVNAVFCDQERNSIFVGGNFLGPNSTNAIAWVANAGWTPLPFAGFNGPVTSITKASNGHIIFGGGFTSLGNTTTSVAGQQDGQVINLSSANITATGSASTTGFSDPTNIVCKTNGADGAGNTWLLQDNTPGAWEAKFQFGFQPSKLRLWNTRENGRGTQTWRFTALPLNGIMNFTYIDPSTGGNASCTSECPLSHSADVPFQDFHFVNRVGMDAFRLDISAWFGAGGGLDGIELFEDDILTYAINAFNEPSCAVSASEASTASTTGPWTVSPSFQSTSEYLTAELTSPVSSSSASVVFSPDIKQSGNYSVNMYTPGCMQDGTCSTRGQVNITVSMVAGQPPVSVQLFQTNNFDKYDQIYFGAVDAPTGAFRPTVTLTPLNNQDLDSMTIVAQRIGFTLLNSTGGLNGLFEYDPTVSTVNTSDFSASAFDKLGASFPSASVVNALAASGDVVYVAGNFTSTAANNIVSVNSQNSSVDALDGSLNGAVVSMALNGTKLFVGGTFTSTESGAAANLNNVAVYDTVKNVWDPLGAGVDGPVMKVVLMTMNVTRKTPEVVVALTGGFRNLLAFGEDNPSVSVDGFGVWVPSQNAWLQNVDAPVERIDGVLLSSLLNVPGADALYGGSLSFAQIGTNGVAALSASGVGSFGVNILPSATTTSTAAAAAATSFLAKRDTLAGSNIAGVITGIFDTSNGRNKTILAGHFTANSTSGTLVQNLLIIDNKNNGVVTGLGSAVADSSTFVALAVTGDTLFAGGDVTGNVNGAEVNGLISYNIATDNFNTQPPTLSGGSAAVSAIQVRPSTSDVYVGGSFLSAGSLGCPGVCYFSTSGGQWNRPGNNLGPASTVNAMVWTTGSTLVAGGSLTVNNTVSTFLGKYDANAQSWDSFPGGTDAVPGPVALLALGSGDGSELWAAGTSNKNGSLFLMKYNGKIWIDAFGASGQTLSFGSNIRSLQVFSVSSNHDSTALLDSSQVLLLTGSIAIPGYGIASAVVFDGKTFQPYALTTDSSNGAGSIASIFVEKGDFFSAGKRGHLPLVGIVLIGLGISLVLMLLIVAAGLLLDRLRKKRQGYVPAPSSYDRGAGMARVPPQELFESLGRSRPGAPQV
ncbi:cellular morphogenesis protein [Niveomyces insectorum RCEF 264]|uniref:Cellular morphogenesis protein n=1 Tax=Niveomyces insectorum RCEF 264 TaxID=1081102 RepID=A0A167WY58_9HYPO|nr:cellular morphogenesis protein [Niveomyces insectorum RCEF 264]